MHGDQPGGEGPVSSPGPARVARLRSHPWTPKVAKLATGSVIATAAGQLTFLGVYASGLAGTRVSTVVAFLVAAVPNYWFSRHWAWRRRGRPDLLRELLPYLATILVNLVVATQTTSWAEAHVLALTDNHLLRVVAVTLTYAATYGVLFVAKFLVFEYLLFGERRRVPGR